VDPIPGIKSIASWKGLILVSAGRTGRSLLSWEGLVPLSQRKITTAPDPGGRHLGSFPHEPTRQPDHRVLQIRPPEGADRSQIGLSKGPQGGQVQDQEHEADGDPQEAEAAGEDQDEKPGDAKGDADVEM